MKIAAALQMLFFLRKLMDQLIGSKVTISIQWAGKKRKYLRISRIYKGGECKRYLQKNIFHKIIYLFLVWSFKISKLVLKSTNKEGSYSIKSMRKWHSILEKNWGFGVPWTENQDLKGFLDQMLVRMQKRMTSIKTICLPCCVCLKQ